MPPIVRVDFSDGILIECDGLPSVHITLASTSISSESVGGKTYLVAEFPKTGTLANREATLNKLIQEYYENKVLLSSLPADDQTRQVPPILSPDERIEKISGKDYLITTLMWIQVHLYSLSPLKYTTRCSDLPITGEWW